MTTSGKVMSPTEGILSLWYFSWVNWSMGFFILLNTSFSLFISFKASLLSSSKS